LRISIALRGLFRFSSFGPDGNTRFKIIDCTASMSRGRVYVPEGRVTGQIRGFLLNFSRLLDSGFDLGSDRRGEKRSMVDR
jgi:hypothetical protein